MADWVSLLAPFDQVRIVQCEMGDGKVWVRYTGTPEDLLACGAVTAEMLAPGRRGKGLRLDADGEWFGIDRQRGQPRIRVFRHKAIERAKRLPGVAGAILVLQEWEAAGSRGSPWEGPFAARESIGKIPQCDARTRVPYLRLVVDNTRPTL